jgi:hypothetical protein
MLSTIETIETKKVLCTMKHTKLLVKATNNYGIKDPSLPELYYFVFKKPLENHHNAEYDTINLHSILKEMYDSKILNYSEEILYTPIITEVVLIDSCNSSDSQLIDYSSKRIKELHEICKTKNIKGYSKMNKANIIKLLCA